MCQNKQKFHKKMPLVPAGWLADGKPQCKTNSKICFGQKKVTFTSVSLEQKKESLNKAKNTEC